MLDASAIACRCLDASVVVHGPAHSQLDRWAIAFPSAVNAAQPHCRRRYVVNERCVGADHVIVLYWQISLRLEPFAIRVHGVIGRLHIGIVY